MASPRWLEEPVLVPGSNLVITSVTMLLSDWLESWRARAKPSDAGTGGGF